MIKVTNLVKKFHMGDSELVALKNLSFEVPTGQFLAITGRSGAGKSTLLYNMSLLDIPTEGVITIDGQDVTNIENSKRVTYRLSNFGFIFQEYALLPTLTSVENVMLPLLMEGLDRAYVEKETKDALEKVGLGERLNNLPSQLSGGQQQRVSIARALTHNPKVLFADEPTANLDTESSKEVLNIFLELNKHGQTIIMVTHEPEYAKIAHRNIELLDGVIIHDGIQRPKKLREIHHD